MISLKARAGREQASQVLGAGAGLLALACSLAVALVLERARLQSVWTLVMAPVFIVAAYWAVARWGARWDRLLVLLPWFRDLVVRRQAVEALIEELSAIMSFYRLAPRFEPSLLEDVKGIPRFTAGLVQELTAAIPLRSTPKDWPGLLIDELEKRTPEWKQKGFGPLLLLLYQERQGQVQRARWREIQENRQALTSLAELLCESETLPDREVGVWTADGVEDILARMPLFSVKVLGEELRLADTIGLYLNFLRDNGVSSPSSPTLHQVLALHRPSPAAVTPAETALLLEETGRIALAGKYAGVPEPLLRSYARLSAVLYLSRSYVHRPIQAHLCCRLAQDPEAVELVWAFLDLKQDLRSENQLGGQPFLTLDYLIHHWQKKVKKAKARASFHRETATLENALSCGDWLARLPDLVERAQIDRLEELIEPGQRQVGRPKRLDQHHGRRQPVPPDTGKSARPPGAGRQALAQELLVQLGLDDRRDLLGTLLQEVSLDSLGRSAETGRFIPYLVTFHAKRGPLSQLIDLLTTPQKLAAAGLAISAPGEEKRMYNFRPYTENTRIGVVPSGYSFEEFQERFQQDLERVLDNAAKLVPPAGGRAGDLKGVEVMLHRFSPVGRYHYPFRSQFSAGLALSHLKEVLAENLESQELLTLVQAGLSTDLRARILEMPIPDVIGNEGGLTSAEATALAKEDHPIKVEFLRLFGAGGMPELAARLADEPTLLDPATEALAGLIHQAVRRFARNQSREIAGRYLKTVSRLASKPSAPSAVPVVPTGSAPARAA